MSNVYHIKLYISLPVINLVVVGFVVIADVGFSRVGAYPRPDALHVSMYTVREHQMNCQTRILYLCYTSGLCLCLVIKISQDTNIPII